MNNFYFYNPTKILFGKNMIERMPAELADVTRVLFLYGQGSVKQNGVYEQTIKALSDKQVIEFGGIEPNPEYETCLRALTLARGNDVEFILAAGGGSVIDAAKFLALAYRCTDPAPWRLITRETPPPTHVLPLGCIQTMPATGSEMNNAFVLSRRETRSKLAFFHLALYPRFSVLDPAVTTTLPVRQTALGIVDAFVHVLEQYVTYPAGGLLQERQAEAILSTLIETAQPLLSTPDDYPLRASVMWCAAQALNGTINRGLPTDWATHTIGHEITALHNLPHAQTLALVLGGVYRHQLAGKQAHLAQYGRRVWQLEGSDEDVAPRAIAATEAFFESLGIATRFSAVGLDAAEVAEAVCRQLDNGNFQALGEHRNLDLAAIGQIIRTQG